MNSVLSRIITFSVLLLSMAFQPTFSYGEAKLPQANEAQLSQDYYCPMHPEQTSHEVGRCPICNMFLVKDELENNNLQNTEAEHDYTHNHANHGAQVNHQSPNLDKLAPLPPKLEQHNHQSVTDNTSSQVKYVCPMHPHVVSDSKDSCPICGMELEPVNIHPTEQIAIQVSGNMQQALAIRTAPVKRGTLWKYINTLGEVAYDEGQINHIHARVKGWIESLAVESEGDEIKQGQLLYQLYSPDLINAQDDYLLAVNASKQSDGAYNDLVRKAALRLELLGMTQKQIKALALSEKTLYRVSFYAKTSGIVKKLDIRPGMYIEPQTELMSIVDINKVWVIANVFEQGQQWLTKGLDAEVSIPNLNIKDIKGKIDYIYPELDDTTRSLRVRIAMDNPNIDLRPNTLVNVSFFGGAKRNILLIPQEALIQTGKQNRVVVKLDDQTFAVKEVFVGMLSQGKAQILSGLNEGELVVTSGQFLLDSEASLKGSLNRLNLAHQH